MMNAADGQPVRLLYIDDDAAFARLVARALGRQGFEVTHAAGGDEGLEALRSGQFDAIALDHVMPGLSGEQTLSAICRDPDHPPIVYVTAADEGRVAVQALKSGAADYVLKDGGTHFFELLAEAIRQAVENLRARRLHAAAQAEIAAARDRAESLLAEVNHRVANSLALVSSFAHLQAAQMPEGEGRDAVMDLKRRIVAVGQVHRRLYTSQDVHRVGMGAYLRGLVEELRISLADEGSVSEIRLEVQDLELPTDRAIAMGVILSELVTNAGKYAYPSGQGGPVSVSLKSVDGGFRLEVADMGIGIGDGAPKGSGLGRRIILAMSKTLKARLSYQPGAPGTRVWLDFPG